MTQATKQAMTYANLITLSAEELTTLRQETQVSLTQAQHQERVEEQRTGGVLDNGYEMAVQERAKCDYELKTIDSALKHVQAKARNESSKRDLPSVPDEFLTSNVYFTKKAELDEREQGFVDDVAQADNDLETLVNQYDELILTGTDKDIKAMYKKVQEAQEHCKVMKSKLHSIQNGTKQRVLEDTAMTVMLSRAHLMDMFKDERERVSEEYKEAKRMMAEAERKQQAFNQRYDNHRNEYQNMITDIVGVGQEHKLTSLYKQR